VAGLSKEATEHTNQVRGNPTIQKEGVRLGDFATTRTLRLELGDENFYFESFTYFMKFMKLSRGTF